ncbi:hypothetical protein E6W36_06235 [Hankyongella ginsenosidimutans]|uniref:MobA-like NTP transferase domain-containing protein n=1 Tax=Hankyongella ginsenosidimutans TaxID=1763828 RepID=A0A4D7BUR5_9SPHN|nr:NTP transferase domain-containing protein [Hankyongella ginsenosidimutans]QCI79299.1 hypothetical protein E6W36_06235 [Hankyongella ginsenosidimutans]
MPLASGRGSHRGASGCRAFQAQSSLPAARHAHGWRQTGPHADGETLLSRALRWAHSQSACLAVAGATRRWGRTARVLRMPSRAWADWRLTSAMAFASARGCAAVLLAGCDLPFLPPDLLLRLTRGIGDSKVAVPVSRGRWHVMAALWRADPGSLAAYIAAGGRSLHGFAERQQMICVDWDTGGEDPFFNVNTADDLQLAEARIRDQR